MKPDYECSTTQERKRPTTQELFDIRNAAYHAYAKAHAESETLYKIYEAAYNDWKVSSVPELLKPRLADSE